MASSSVPLAPVGMARMSDRRPETPVQQELRDARAQAKMWAVYVADLEKEERRELVDLAKIEANAAKQAALGRGLLGAKCGRSVPKELIAPPTSMPGTPGRTAPATPAGTPVPGTPGPPSIWPRVSSCKERENTFSDSDAEPLLKEKNREKKFKDQEGDVGIKRLPPGEFDMDIDDTEVSDSIKEKNQKKEKKHKKEKRHKKEKKEGKRDAPAALGAAEQTKAEEEKTAQLTEFRDTEAEVACESADAAREVVVAPKAIYSKKFSYADIGIDL